MKRNYLLFLALVMAFVLSGCSKDVKNQVISMDVNGQSVEGEFTGTLENNIATGDGVFKVNIDDTSSWVYTGEFADNSFTGTGIVEGYPLTVSYDGVDISGLYSGDMDNGKVSGEGSFLDTEEEITFEYTGNWLDGKLADAGTLKYDKYIVHFAEKDREGIFDGSVVDGIANGEGTFTAVNDEDISYVYTGAWENGLYQGFGTLKYDSDDYCSRIGTFTEGEFTPTELEYIQALGTAPKMKFEVNDMAAGFIGEHPEFFVTEDPTILDPFVDQELGYKQLMKSSDQYGDKLVKFSNYNVFQIWEQQDFWGKTLTSMLAVDRDYKEYLYVFYLGSASNIYEGSKITFYALPINSTAYETTGGGLNNCYVFYACYVE